MSCKSRSLAAYDPRMQEGLRCPWCQGIDWVRDGVSVAETADSSLLVEGVIVLAQRPGDWRCLRCGYAADEASRMSRILVRAVIASRFADLG